jgi:ubiquinone/menaquinone biosynthesis C-methylase UbiE
MHRKCIRQVTIVAIAAGSLVLSTAVGARSQAPGAGDVQRPKTDSKINEPFKDPDVRGFIKKFETDDREIHKKRHEIVAALALTPGMAVADVGAGTGLFTRLIAEAVGPKGKVYAVDVSSRFLAHISADAKKRRHTHVATVLGTQDSTNLPPKSVDLVFLSDVYHHLEKPDKTLASIRQALRPGGRLAVIEFDRIEGKSAEFVLKHVRASQEVFRKEIEAAGFTLQKVVTKPKLSENFFLIFERSNA